MSQASNEAIKVHRKPTGSTCHASWKLFHPEYHQLQFIYVLLKQLQTSKYTIFSFILIFQRICLVTLYRTRIQVEVNHLRHYLFLESRLAYIIHLKNDIQ